MTAIVFLSPAQEEMTAAAGYYQTQSLGLGAEFLAEVEQATAAIALHPKAAPKVKSEHPTSPLEVVPFRHSLCRHRR